MTEPSDFIGEQALSDWLGISTYTAQQWRARHEGPPYVKMGRAVRYSRAAVEKWILTRTITPPERK